MTTLNDRFSCVLMGEESLLVQCGELLLGRGHTVAGVVSENPSITSWADGHGIKTMRPDANLKQAVSDLAFDWFFSIGNLRMIPEAVWGQAAKGAVNFHDGPLPKYAGLNTPSWALLAGETSHGVTWHKIADGVDTGDILVQRIFDVGEGETSLSLNTKCFEAGIETFSDLTDKIEAGSLEGQAQDFSGRIYCAKDKRPAAFATIDFSQPALEIDRLARALDFGPGYRNPLGLLKLKTASHALNVTGLEAASLAQPLPAGTVVEADDQGAVVAAGDGAVRILGLMDNAGNQLRIAKTLPAGTVLPVLNASDADALTALSGQAAKQDGYFAGALAEQVDLELAGMQPSSGGEADWARFRLELPSGLSGNRGAAAVVAALTRISGLSRFDVGFSDDALTEQTNRYPGYLAPSLPLTVTSDDETTVETLSEEVSERLAGLRRRGPYAADLALRTPNAGNSPLSVAVRVTANGDTASVTPVQGAAVTFVVPDTGGGSLSLAVDQSRLSQADASVLVKQLQSCINAFADNEAQTVNALPVMSEEEQRALLDADSETLADYNRAALVHQLIEAQADRTPDATAVICEGRSVTYRELDERANRLAHRLIELGAGSADSLVGLYMRRSVELVVSALAIMKAGAAYVPLDPDYPRDRIALIIEDSGLDVVLTEEALVRQVPGKGVKTLTIEGAEAASTNTSRPATQTRSDNLAYVIYTSGSTGRPKGVMIEHRNVANFFTGMNGRVPVPADKQPVWLAVTSLSFDISVLELFWTLTRGFAVVVYVDEKSDARPATARRKAAPGGMDFSLFYWGHNDATGPDTYKLLLDGARMADERGFCAVWMPERHFHDFGGSYPNPSVTGAAVAAITRNIEIRAGSCVLPLHHPARVAEEWAVIDTLSNGRTGMAFASGWMPEDFVLRPENAPPKNKPALLRDIDVVRRMWRGEKVALPSPIEDGKEIEIVTQPRPITPELNVWVTSAGNPETYRDAARLGANVLTHLLGHSIDELAAKIKIYRDTLVETGRDPSKFKVTLMLHTLVGDDREEVRELARGPMKNYLKSAAALIKQYAWAFPAFKKPDGVSNPMELDLRALEEEEMDAIIEFAFLRYFDDSGLFGTIDDALARVEQVKAIGVDEIACLIDFGVPNAVAMKHMHPLAQVVETVNASAKPVVAESPAEAVDGSFANLIRHYGVTHMQCTPAMATMLLIDDDNRNALGSVEHLFVGGEALPGTLLQDLRSSTKATIENMYGPTETTVWSSTCTAEGSETVVPLGKAIANTQLYILDSKGRPVPAGVPGELYISGDGVARGYHNRSDLTQERFLANPFIEGKRMYRTGDLVRRGPDGTLHFIGRTDHQVKVRGYRIELGEIESRLGDHPSIKEAVVIVRQDKANDARIVAYFRHDGPAPSDDDLREHVRGTLPEFMVPAHFVAMANFPLTPNAKVDRKALPPPGASAKAEAAPRPFVAPDGEIQVKIADAFKRILGLETVGVNDNFFTLGGHSLLAVQIHRDLKANVASQISITDIYRFPTVAGLAGHLSDSGEADKSLAKAASRAAMRRNAMAGRRTVGAR